jgi:hypothetical protein
MKKLNKFRQAGGAFLALAALVTLTPSASAVNFIWRSGPLAGSPFVGGSVVEIKAFNHDTGTLYNPQPVGTVLTGAGLNAQIARPALGPAAFTNEDSWGILQITDIIATVPGTNTTASIYNHLVDPFELTGMFWGIQDFRLQQVSLGSGLAGGGQVIDGAGMFVNIYSDPAKNFNPDPNGGNNGPLDRTGVSSFPTVTDGVLELSLQSTPGFINAAGTFGGVATEFESNTANVGYAALNVIGGASAAQFNTNAIGFGGSYGADFLPGVGGQAATDFWFKSTSSQGQVGWDIRSNDPMYVGIAGPSVPDSGSTLILLATALLGLACGQRVRRTRT